MRATRPPATWAHLATSLFPWAHLVTSLSSWARLLTSLSPAPPCATWQLCASSWVFNRPSSHFRNGSYNGSCNGSCGPNDAPAKHTWSASDELRVADLKAWARQATSPRGLGPHGHQPSGPGPT